MSSAEKNVILNQVGNGVALVVVALALAACAAGDDTSRSQLSQQGAPGGAEAKEGGDIAIAGQEVAHEMNDLPEVKNAPKPPLVQFIGVTSIVNGPLDTEPYTDLLRDRLLLVTRLHLRFVERQLPPLVSQSKKIKSRKELPPDEEINSSPDYQVVAELRGNYDDDRYFVQIQFVDLHSGAILINETYRIRKEAQTAPSGETTITNQVFPTAQPGDPNSPAAVTGAPPPTP